MTRTKEIPELVRLLDQRWKELGLEHIKQFHAPASPDLRECARACNLHAEANKSDPFAAARMALHLRRGIETPGDVAKAAQSLLATRVRYK